MYVLKGAADFYQTPQIPLKWFDNPTIMLHFCSRYDVKSEISYAFRVMATVDKFLSCSKHSAKKILQTK